MPDRVSMSPPAATSATSTSAGSRDTSAPANPVWLGAAAELLGTLPVVGKLIKLLVERRMWGPLVAAAALVLLLLVYPLLVPFLAAYWTNQGVLLGARDAYVDEVRAAFRVREAADAATVESYKRLDYFIPIEFSRRARDGKTFDLPVTPMQKVQLRIAPGRLTSSDPVNCSIPTALVGEGADLMDVLLNDMPVGRVQNQGEPRDIVLTKKDWEGFRAPGETQSMHLSFRPVPDLRAACEQLQVEVKVSVLVFKDLYKR